MTSMAALDERQLLVEGIKEKGTESRADLKYVPEGKFQICQISIIIRAKLTDKLTDTLIALFRNM